MRQDLWYDFDPMIHHAVGQSVLGTHFILAIFSEIFFLACLPSIFITQ